MTASLLYSMSKFVLETLRMRLAVSMSTASTSRLDSTFPLVHFPRRTSLLFVGTKSGPGTSSTIPHLSTRKPCATVYFASHVDLCLVRPAAEELMCVVRESSTSLLKAITSHEIRYSTLGASNGIALALDLDDPSECPGLEEGEKEVR